MFFEVYNIVIFYILITQDKKMAYVKKTKTSDTATPSKQNIAPPQPVKNNEDEDFSAELIKQINRDNGSKIAFNLAHDEAPTNIKRWISTGSTQLDYIIRNDAGGGAPEGRIIEIQGPPSCHAKGDRVMMYNGTLKNIEDVRVGDKLMGPDSTPREVLSLARGRDELYRVVPGMHGKPFHVSAKHKLVLRKTKSSHGGPQDITIPVDEYIEQNQWFKNSYSMKRTAVDFHNIENLPMPAYILGLLLGDGSLSARRIELTTADEPIANAYKEYCNSLGYEVSTHKKQDNVAFGLYHKTGSQNNQFVGEEFDPDQIRAVIRNLGLLNKHASEKFIPLCYKTASRKERLDLLAGLIDTDGHYDSKKNSYEFSSKSLTLVQDVSFVARTCGLKTGEPNPKVVNGEVYYRLTISGAIPSRLSRKISLRENKRQQNLTHGFDLVSIGEGDIFGVTVDKDHLYLMEDTTISHNCGKSHLAYEICKSTQRMGGIAVYIDTENATSLENLIQVGIDVKKRFVFIQQTCIEEIFKIIESTIEKARNLKADIPVVVIWDSVAASSPKAEIDGDYDQNTIGLAARVLSKGLRKITHVIGDKNVLLVLLNQQRTKVGVMYGDPTTTPGGQAIPYHSSVRLKLTGGQQIKKTVNGKEMVIGINVAVKTIKNKVARPWREVEFEIHFGVGIRESEQLFDALREYCDKVKPKLNVNGVRPIIAGTSQWKELNLYDATTGVEIEQVKFFKSEFGKKIMGDPKYRVYADALVHACFHIPKEDNDHATLVGADMNSVEEAEAVALESGAEIENYN